MFSDKEILDTYNSGFSDELWGNPVVQFDELILEVAYNLGRDHAIIGDDVPSIDLLGNDEIINSIKNTCTQKMKSKNS